MECIFAAKLVDGQGFKLVSHVPFSGPEAQPGIERVAASRIAALECCIA